MKRVLLLLIVAFTFASDFDHIVAKVNSNPLSTWTAEAPSHRFGSMADVKMTLGALPRNATLDAEDPIPEMFFASLVAAPETFDARTNWPNCTVISKVRDQSSCGSCWAFASTEAFEDSRCIATGEDIMFSTMDTAGCCSGFLCGLSMGCNGGQPSRALQWMTRTGVVTGGSYFDKGNGKYCKDYEFAPCAHHVPPTAKYPKCPQQEYSASCKKSCSDSGYGKSYESDKTKGSRAFSLSSVSDMQAAIMKTGPLAVAFTVYEDFPTYKSGVYKHSTGGALGGHAVEMVGWGTENGTPYWLIKNSWNEQWGDGGFFKIARGVNECGIEDDVTGISFD